MRRLILLVALLALAGCGTSTPERSGNTEGLPPLEEANQGNFTLYVSNQSFDRDNVDIRVLVDGRPVVIDDFAVESQHNWVEYRFDLDDGRHTLRAESLRGEAVFEGTFRVKGKRWAVVDYWCCGNAGEPNFTFRVRGEPIAFA
jgi:hypothetical protein